MNHQAEQLLREAAMDQEENVVEGQTFCKREEPFVILTVVVAVASEERLCCNSKEMMSRVQQQIRIWHLSEILPLLPDKKLYLSNLSDLPVRSRVFALRVWVSTMMGQKANNDHLLRNKRSYVKTDSKKR